MLSKSDLQAIKALIDESVITSANSLRNELKNEIIKFKDEIMARLDKIDQELAITNGYGGRLEEHDERSTKLESIYPDGKHI